MKSKCNRCGKDYEIKPDADLMVDWHVLLGLGPECAKKIDNEKIELGGMTTHFFNEEVPAKEFFVHALKENFKKRGLPESGKISSEKELALKVAAHLDALYNAFLIFGSPRTFHELKEDALPALAIIIESIKINMGLDIASSKNLMTLLTNYSEEIRDKFVGISNKIANGPFEAAEIGALTTIEQYTPWLKNNRREPENFRYDLLNFQNMEAYPFMQAGVETNDPWEILWVNEKQRALAEAMISLPSTNDVNELRNFRVPGSIIDTQSYMGARGIFFERGVNSPAYLYNNETERLANIVRNSERVFGSILAHALLKVDKSDTVHSLFSAIAPTLVLKDQEDGKIFNESYSAYLKHVRNPLATTSAVDFENNDISVPRKKDEILPFAKSLLLDIKSNKADNWGLHSVGLLTFNPIVREAIKANKAHGAIIIQEAGRTNFMFMKDADFKGLKNARAACEMVKRYAESQGISFGSPEFEKFGLDRKIFVFTPSRIIVNKQNNETGVSIYQFATKEIEGVLINNRGIDKNSLVREGDSYYGMTITRGATFNDDGQIVIAAYASRAETQLTHEQEIVSSYADERGGSSCWSISMQNLILNGELNKFYPAPSPSEMPALHEKVKEDPTLIQAIGLAISQTGYKFDE